MRATVVRARVEDDLKKQACEVLETLGITMSDAIHMFLRQTVLTQALPFPLHVPNEATRKAMQDARERKNLIIPKPGKTIFEDLLSDDEE